MTNETMTTQQIRNIRIRINGMILMIGILVAHTDLIRAGRPNKTHLVEKIRRQLMEDNYDYLPSEDELLTVHQEYDPPNDPFDKDNDTLIESSRAERDVLPKKQHTPKREEKKEYLDIAEHNVYRNHRPDRHEEAERGHKLDTDDKTDQGFTADIAYKTDIRQVTEIDDKTQKSHTAERYNRIDRNYRINREYMIDKDHNADRDYIANSDDRASKYLKADINHRKDREESDHRADRDHGTAMNGIARRDDRAQINYRADELHEPKITEFRENSKANDHAISKKDLYYYVDDDKLVRPRNDEPEIKNDMYDANDILPKVKYKLINVKSQHPHRRSNSFRRFVQEQTADGVAMISLDGSPFPEFHLPRSRRQYMQGDSGTDLDDHSDGNNASGRDLQIP